MRSWAILCISSPSRQRLTKGYPLHSLELSTSTVGSCVFFRGRARWLDEEACEIDKETASESGSWSGAGASSPRSVSGCAPEDDGCVASSVTYGPVRAPVAPCARRPGARRKTGGDFRRDEAPGSLAKPESP